MRQLFVDLGHSVKFPGASGVKSEVDWNRAVWRALWPLINSQKWQVVAVPTAFATDFIPSANLNLIQRIRWINAHAHDGDWVLSIHGNAAGNPAIRGVETCFYTGSSYAQQLAAQLSAAYSKATGVPLFAGGTMGDMSGRYGRIGMIRDTKPLALLIECGFVTNQQDMQVPASMAAQGIAAFLNAQP